MNENLTEMRTDLSLAGEGANPTPPKVSVIVPVYKVEKYLPECIESVLAQTFTDFELILVDDGSPDNSGKICDDYAARDSRIRVFHKENGGVVSARMEGLSESAGKYVIFLDGDDTWTRTALSGLVSLAEVSQADFIRGGFFYESEERKIRSVVIPDLSGVFSVGELLSRPFKTLFDYTAMCVWGNLYRKEIALSALGDVGNVHINHSEDGLFAVAAFLHSEKIAFSRDPFYYYLQRKGSAVHRFNSQVVEAQEGFCCAMENVLRKSGRIPENRTEEIILEHMFYACAYTWNMLFCASSFTQMREILYKLRACRFFCEAEKKSERMKMKRRALFVLINSTMATATIYILRKYMDVVLSNVQAFRLFRTVKTRIGGGYPPKQRNVILLPPQGIFFATGTVNLEAA